MCYNIDSKEPTTTQLKEEKKMTKRDCIAYCATAQKKSWENPTDYAKRTEAYEDAKKVCKANGYTGGTFHQIWDAATRENAIERGVYRG